MPSPIDFPPTPFEAGVTALTEDSGLPPWGQYRHNIERRMRIFLNAFEAANAPAPQELDGAAGGEVIEGHRVVNPDWPDGSEPHIEKVDGDV